MDLDSILKTTGKIAKTVGYVGTGMIEKVGKRVTAKMESEGRFEHAENSEKFTEFVGSVKDKLDDNYMTDLKNKISEKTSGLFGNAHNDDDMDE